MTEAEKAEKKAVCKLAAASGDGLKKIYEELGCDLVLCGKSDGSISPEDFRRAVLSLNAEKVIVFPNGKLSHAAAEQAKKLLDGTDTEIFMIPTENAVEGYFALALDIPDLTDFSARIEKMMQFKDGLHMLGITVAKAKGQYDGIACDAGDFLSVVDGKVVAAKKYLNVSTVCAFQMCKDLADKDSCIIFYGKTVKDEELQELEQLLETSLPGIEAEFFYGGQEDHLLIGLV